MCCVKEEYLLMKMHCNSWMQIREGSSKIVTAIFHSQPPILYVVGHQEPILQLAKWALGVLQITDRGWFGNKWITYGSFLNTVYQLISPFTQSLCEDNIGNKPELNARINVYYYIYTLQTGPRFLNTLNPASKQTCQRWVDAAVI